MAYLKLKGLLVSWLFCQAATASPVAPVSDLTALTNLLKKIHFTSRDAHYLVSQALTLRSVPEWLYNARANYKWLALKLPANANSLILNKPWLLGLSVSQHFEPRIATLKSFGIPDVYRLCAQASELLNPNIRDKTMIEMVSLLKTEGVQDIVKLIDTYPGILIDDPKRAINLNIRWLKQTFGMKKVGPFLERMPDFFGYNTSLEIQPIFKFLRDNWYLDLTDIEIHPQLLTKDMISLSCLKEALTDLKLNIASDFTLEERRLLISYSNASIIIRSNLINLGVLEEGSWGVKSAKVQTGWLLKNIDKWAFDPQTSNQIFNP